MRTRWIATILLSTVVVAMASFMLTRAVRSGQASDASATPFTALMVERHYMPGSSEPDAVHSYTYAVRSDGSSVEVFRRQFPNREWFDMRVVTDLTDRKRLSVDPSTQSTVTYPLSARTVAKIAAAMHACSAAGNAAARSLLGYQTYRNTHDSSRPEELRKFEQWRAPALDCFALDTVNTLGSASAPERITRQALSVRIGEPLGDLFKVPAGYTERSPSEVSAEFERRFNQPIFPEGPAKLDEVYSSAQHAQ